MRSVSIKWMGRNGVPHRVVGRAGRVCILVKMEMSLTTDGGKKVHQFIHQLAEEDKSAAGELWEVGTHKNQNVNYAAPQQLASAALVGQAKF
eukprot:5970844-Amphidinium_carterae.1